MKSEPMREQAILVPADQPSIDDGLAGRLLEFFGVPYQTQTATDFRLPEDSHTESDTNYRLVCAAETFGRIVGTLQNALHGAEGFAQRIHSVLLYPTGNSAALVAAVSQLSGAKISIHKGAGSEIEWRIADVPGGVCGAMRGLRVRPTPATLESCDFFDANGSSVTPLIAAGNKSAFLKLTCNNVPVFASSERLIDI